MYLDPQVSVPYLWNNPLLLILFGFSVCTAGNKSLAALTEVIPRPKIGINARVEGGGWPGRVDEKPTPSGSPAQTLFRAGLFSCPTAALVGEIDHSTALRGLNLDRVAHSSARVKSDD
jgi:hypothetical protein